MKRNKLIEQNAPILFARILSNDGGKWTHITRTMAGSKPEYMASKLIKMAELLKITLEYELHPNARIRIRPERMTFSQRYGFGPPPKLSRAIAVTHKIPTIKVIP